MKEYIEVADSLGIQGIHFFSAQQLKEALSIKLPKNI
jgi:hypothetical protein